MEEQEQEKEDIENHQENLLKKIREEYREVIYKEKLDQIENYPWEWLQEMGYADRHSLSKNAINSGIIDFDIEGMVDDLTDGYDFDSIAPYKDINIGGETYYIFDID